MIWLTGEELNVGSKLWVMMAKDRQQKKPYRWHIEYYILSVMYMYNVMFECWFGFLIWWKHSNSIHKTSINTSTEALSRHVWTFCQILGQAVNNMPTNVDFHCLENVQDCCTCRVASTTDKQNSLTFPWLFNDQIRFFTDQKLPNLNGLPYSLPIHP